MLFRSAVRAGPDNCVVGVVFHFVLLSIFSPASLPSMRNTLAGFHILSTLILHFLFVQVLRNNFGENTALLFGDYGAVMVEKNGFGMPAPRSDLGGTVQRTPAKAARLLRCLCVWFGSRMQSWLFSFLFSFLFVVNFQCPLAYSSTIPRNANFFVARLLASWQPCSRANETVQRGNPRGVGKASEDRRD